MGLYKQMALRQTLNCFFIVLLVFITSNVFADQSEEQAQTVSESETVLTFFGNEAVVSR
jgi:hypothetical protein